MKEEVRRKVVRQIRRMQAKGRMGTKEKELRGGYYHTLPPFHPL